MNINFISEITGIASNIAVILTALFAANQIRKMQVANKLAKESLQIEHIRSKRLSTIEFYQSMEQESKDFIDNVMMGIQSCNLESIIKDSALEKTIRRYLSFMERFAVGIHSDIYDLDIFDLIQGQTALYIFKALLPYVTFCEERFGTTFYKDYKRLIFEIQTRRSKRESNSYQGSDEQLPLILN